MTKGSVESQLADATQFATAMDLKKTTGQLQKLLGQFTILISDLLKKVTGMDLFVSFLHKTEDLV